MKRTTVALGTGLLAGMAEVAYGVVIEGDVAVVFLAGFLAFAIVFVFALGVLRMLNASSFCKPHPETHREYLWREWMSTPAGTIGSEADREYHQL